MKNKFNVFLLFFMIISFCSNASVSFNDYFENKTVRMNYAIAGSAQKTEIFVSKYYVTDIWAGTKKHLTDCREYGPFRIDILDKTSGILIYSQSFSSLFFEWQGLTEAASTTASYRETVRFPLPKSDAVINIYQRDSELKFQKIFTTDFNPSSYFINKEKNDIYPSKIIYGDNQTDNKVDLVIIPDGYSQNEMDKFEKRANEYAQHLFMFEPYKSNSDKFNIRIVLAPSFDSGVDLPGQGIWKSTLLDCNYWTFNMPRYLTTENYWKVCDVASCVPWDHVVILCNSDIYGGGGIYNYYSIFSAENTQSLEVFVHEFGHAFSGLGDEYESAGANDSYPTEYKLEPYEPNLTSLVDFKSKWADLVDKKTPVPTPKTSKYDSKVGAFEGGNYTEKGIFRPTMHCMMHDLQNKFYCPVCERITQDIINYWTD